MGMGVLLTTGVCMPQCAPSVQVLHWQIVLRNPQARRAIGRWIQACR